jgi:3',5'-cyclic AMP phosphodiesterase CpdA
MKKIFLIIFLTALALAGGFFFLKTKDLKILPSQAELGNSADPRTFDSFRGVVNLEYKRPVVQTNEQNLPPGQSPFSETSPEQQGESSTANKDLSFSFAILGDTQSFDSGNSNGNFQKAMKKISEKNPDLVIAMGDLVSSSENYTEYSQKFFEWKRIMSPLLSKTYAAMGNHDNIDQKGEKAWQEAFNFPSNGPTEYSETVYSLDFKNSHFVFLNSDHEKEHLVNGDQRAWFEQDLAANKKENIFVVFHEPAYPVSDKKGEGLDADPSERNALWEILDRHNVTAVFNGHEHIVSQRKIDSRVSSVAKNSIYQFVFGNTDSFNHGLPSAGVAEYANQGQGRFGLVKVNGKEITVETHDSSGTILNTFTFSK